MLEGADVKYSIDLLLSYFPHDIGSSTVSKRMSHCFWELVFFLKFFQWCVSSQNCLQVTQNINSIVLWSAVQMKLKLPWLSLAKEVKVHFM